MAKEQQILDKLKRIIDPDLGRDIVSLGFIKNLKITEDGMVLFNIELTTPACPVKEVFRQQATDAVKELDWVKSVDVTMTARKAQQRKQPQADGIAKVRKIIGVSSCKGGVGKSTVSTNLAFSLLATGAKVGIFDADVYGPSLPTMVKTDEADLFRTNSGLLKPLEHSSGMKLMSFGYATSNSNNPAIMRGPMVSRVIQQLLLETDWGELDYLVIDLPPGTGDIQLTISQTVPLDGAVIVTTPQKISFIDVVKGIEMFDKLKIPTIAVVENMSYFLCDGCDKRHEIFGKGAKSDIVNQFGIENAFEIPMVPEIAQQGDNGLPIVAAQPDGRIAEAYKEISADVVRELSRLEFSTEHPVVTNDAERGVVYAKEGNEKAINPAELRRSCGCAECVSEYTGEQILQPEDVPDDVKPLELHTMGNYAITIQWSDGHSSIFPYTSLEKL